MNTEVFNWEIIINNNNNPSKSCVKLDGRLLAVSTAKVVIDVDKNIPCLQLHIPLDPYINKFQIITDTTPDDSQIIVATSKDKQLV